MPDISSLLGLPPNVSTHGHEIDNMMSLIHWLMFILFVIWTPYFVYTLIRFRRSKNPKASYQGAKGRLSTVQEIGVVVVEALLLVGFAIPLWASLKTEFPSEEESVVVNVVGEQFAWNMHYPGPDGVFGKQDKNLVDTQTNPLGLVRDDPNAQDDIVMINELHLPVGKPAIIHLSSKDVIHSFFLPQMRVKQDAIPGIEVPIWFEPKETGEFEIACAQLCGLGHYRMRGYLIIHTPEEYEEWLKTKQEEKELYGW